MERIRTITPHGSEGRIYRNDGQINPVAHKATAWNMAIAEDRVRRAHENAVIQTQDGIANGSTIQQLSSRTLRYILTVPLVDQIEAATERTRMSSASQDLAIAKQVYNLVEFAQVAQS